MAVSKRIFEAVAADFRAVHTMIGEEHDRKVYDTGYAYMVHEGLVRRMSDVFAAENPNFDRSRFMAACRGEDSTDMAGRKVSYSKDPNGSNRAHRGLGNFGHKV